jgi:23S rRNA (uracil1939-C5)-methyltransferase
MAAELELRIDRVGAQGDGVADGESGPVFVPLTLAGELVRADVKGDRGRLLSVIEASPNRVAPVCRHFGVCGGCALQHMAAPIYAAWKQSQVVAAFRSRGIDADVSDVVACAGKRRRAVFAAKRTSGGVVFGFHETGSHELVDLAICPVVDERIVAALPALRDLVSPLVSRRGELRVTATWTDAGLDISLEESGQSLTAEIRAHIAKVAIQNRFARVSISGDMGYKALAPFMTMGAAQVVLPPGVFLQAVAEAEAAMADLIVAAVGKAKKVVDLFSGVGAFAFRLAEASKVFAADSDKVAIAALVAASKKTSGLKPVEAIVRDLFREPLSGTELNAYDAVVFDPPRAGAEAQAKMIARSKVKTAVAVSCNPATLARDVRILIDGGYRLESVTPVDQFLYSSHIEVVAVLRR